MTLQVLVERGQSNRSAAALLGVTEGAVRYRLKTAGRPDGRANQVHRAATHAVAVEQWMRQQPGGERPEGTYRPVNVCALHDWLVAEHGYTGSYQSVLRFVRSRYGRPKLRPFRRVETPPGAQAQVDWGEFPGLDAGAGPETLYAFVMLLSHSRQAAVVWSRRMDQLAWQHVHNEALVRLGGVPAVLRIDNLKTGIGQGAGPWGEVTDAYRSYARAVGFHVDACLPRCPEDKGKVENAVGQLRRRLDPTGLCFDGLSHLQTWTDERLARWAERRTCPATGLSIAASFADEQPFLRPLPVLPAVFDVAVTRPVHADCTVSFENRGYSVPFVLCGLTVEVRGCAEVVQVLHDGRVVAEHPRHSRQRLLIDPAHYDGPGDDRVLPPVPLGKMGRKLREIVALPVEQRPLDLYAALAEVAR